MTSKADKPEIRPWEQVEGREKKPSHGGSIPPKTSVSSRLSAKPKVSRQEYMDMYILSKQKERTEKYGDTLYKRQMAVTKEWEGINEALEKVEKKLQGDRRKSGRESRRKKSEKYPENMKKIDWDY